MKKLKLSPLEKRIIRHLRDGDEMSITELAEVIYDSLPRHYQPKNPNNSIVSAIRQINRKRVGTVKGTNRGRNGKLVHLSKPAIRLLTLN